MKVKTRRQPPIEFYHFQGRAKTGDGIENPERYIELYSQGSIEEGKEVKPSDYDKIAEIPYKMDMLNLKHFMDKLEKQLRESKYATGDNRLTDLWRGRINLSTKLTTQPGTTADDVNERLRLGDHEIEDAEEFIVGVHAKRNGRFLVLIHGLDAEHALETVVDYYGDAIEDVHAIHTVPDNHLYEFYVHVAEQFEEYDDACNWCNPQRDEYIEHSIDELLIDSDSDQEDET